MTTATDASGALPTGPARRTRPVPPRIPFTRIVSVELRKGFDTQSGFWLMTSIVLLALIATATTVLLGPAEQLTYERLLGSVGFPMAVILPMIAALSVTGEWSQRTGLTSFALVPHRGRVITAKLTAMVLVGAVSTLLAAVIGAMGNVAGSAIAGVDVVWDVSAGDLDDMVLANVLGMLMGFAFGVLFRSSVAAIVGYFVYGFVLPPLSMLLANHHQSYRDAQPWVDFNYDVGNLFNGLMSGDRWTQLGVAGLIWLLAPMAIGMGTMFRSEVK